MHVTPYSSMQIGDLVIRKSAPEGWKNQPAMEQRKRLGHGIILAKQMSGNPSHPCITVFYPKTGEIWDIAESLMEILAKGRNLG